MYETYSSPPALPESAGREPLLVARLTALCAEAIDALRLARLRLDEPDAVWPAQLVVVTQALATVEAGDLPVIRDVRGLLLATRMLALQPADELDHVGAVIHRYELDDAMTRCELALQVAARVAARPLAGAGA